MWPTFGSAGPAGGPRRGADRYSGTSGAPSPPGGGARSAKSLGPPRPHGPLARWQTSTGHTGTATGDRTMTQLWCFAPAIWLPAIAERQGGTPQGTAGPGSPT
eukprot:10336359-Alexandrium_andersonii.AAC.1